MARPLRIEFPGAVYHITSRGNERKAIFRDDRDRKIFLDTLKGVYPSISLALPCILSDGESLPSAH